ncbi:MAG: hypothetical protein ACKOA8_15430, partial [Deltaproteobacteria bacterium]
MNFLLTILIFSLVRLSPADDAVLPKASAVILCYPTDKIIRAACEEIERRLNQCETAKIQVIRKDNLNQESISSSLRESKLSAHTPVFVVGHGGADRDHHHYLATKLFWKDHPENVKPEAFPRLLEEGNLIPGKVFNKEIIKAIPDPALWYLSCHSGGNCTEGGNIGASCSSWETSTISQFNPVFKFNLKLDPATRRILSVLCTPGEFEKADQDANGRIEQKEWLTVFKSDFEKSVKLPTELENSKNTPETQQRILKQVS